MTLITTVQKIKYQIRSFNRMGGEENCLGYDYEKYFGPLLSKAEEIRNKQPNATFFIEVSSMGNSKINPEELSPKDVRYLLEQLPIFFGLKIDLPNGLESTVTALYDAQQLENPNHFLDTLKKFLSAKKNQSSVFNLFHNSLHETNNPFELDKNRVYAILAEEISNIDELIVSNLRSLLRKNGLVLNQRINKGNLSISIGEINKKISSFEPNSEDLIVYLAATFLQNEASTELDDSPGRISDKIPDEFYEFFCDCVFNPNLGYNKIKGILSEATLPYFRENNLNSQLEELEILFLQSEPTVDGLFIEFRQFMQNKLWNDDLPQRSDALNTKRRIASADISKIRAKINTIISTYKIDLPEPLVRIRKLRQTCPLKLVVVRKNIGEHPIAQFHKDSPIESCTTKFVSILNNYLSGERVNPRELKGLIESINLISIGETPAILAWKAMTPEQAAYFLSIIKRSKIQSTHSLIKRDYLLEAIPLVNLQKFSNFKQRLGLRKLDLRSQVL